MTFKAFLPVENYILATKLPVEEVLKRVNDNLQPRPNFNIKWLGSRFDKPYSGTIDGNSFTMTRNINYRNSFLPVITGEVSSFLGKTEVKVRMRLVTVVLIFICLWLGVIGVASIVMIVDALSGSNEIIPGAYSVFSLAPLGMFAFGCLLTVLAFKFESRKSKKFLATLLEGAEEPGSRD